MREDFLLNNTISFFKKEFVTAGKEMEDLMGVSFSDDFIGLLPDSPLIVG